MNSGITPSYRPARGLPDQMSGTPRIAPRCSPPPSSFQQDYQSNVRSTSHAHYHYAMLLPTVALHTTHNIHGTITISQTQQSRSLPRHSCQSRKPNSSTGMDQHTLFCPLPAGRRSVPSSEVLSTAGCYRRMYRLWSLGACTVVVLRGPSTNLATSTGVLRAYYLCQVRTALFPLFLFLFLLLSRSSTRPRGFLLRASRRYEGA
jgi:hypothetical protein